MKDLAKAYLKSKSSRIDKTENHMHFVIGYCSADRDSMIMRLHHYRVLIELGDISAIFRRVYLCFFWQKLLLWQGNCDISSTNWKDRNPMDTDKKPDEQYINYTPAEHSLKRLSRSKVQSNHRTKRFTKRGSRIQFLYHSSSETA